MLIRCHKESQHPAVDPKTSGWSSKRTRKTQRDGHNSGVKIWSLCSISSTLSHANFEQPFRTLAIKWEVNIFLKKSSCVFLPASLLCVVYSCVCLWYCVVVMLNDDVDDYITITYNTRFETSNLIVNNNTNSTEILPNQTNVVYKFICQVRECLSENKITSDTLICYTTTTLYRRLTLHLSK